MPDVLTQVVPKSQMPYDVYRRELKQGPGKMAQDIYGVSTPNILHQMYRRYTGQPNTLRQIPARAFQNMIPLLLGGAVGGAPEARMPEIPLERPPGAAEYRPGSIGAEAQKTGGAAPQDVKEWVNNVMAEFDKLPEAPPETRLVRRPGPPEGMNPMDLFQIKLNSLGPLGESMGMKVSPINQKAYHVYDAWYNHLLGGFDTHEEAVEFINRAINSPVTEELPPRDIQSWKWPQEYLGRTPRDHKGLLSPKRPPRPFEASDYYSGNGNGGNGH